ncbi:MAG: hypothetical protein OZ921_17155 [Sorangiineae bacterium]|nr:hypothetical protein [Polyangiaceae bacterium]MEB2324245.1 hypothetical protein [Sorangiineae bacterium]
MPIRGVFIAGALAVAAGCDAPAPGRHPFRGVFPSASPPAPETTVSREAPPSAVASERARCEARLEALRREPALPGAPGLEARRAEVLARAKHVPVLFRRPPAVSEAGGAEVAMYRATLERSAAPAWELIKLRRNLVNRPEVARALLLREGYLYAETPGMAAALSELVDLSLLFREPALRLERGAALLSVKRRGLGYEYADGPEAGEPAHLLLFDRVWVEGSDPGPPLHAELRPLSRALGFERMKVERLTGAGLVAELRYGDDWVPTALELRGAELSLGCELIPDGKRARVEAARALAARAESVLDLERAAVDELVRDALPFDEPRTEHGQQDGNLRPAWRFAYDHGWDYYRFNDDTYRVFDLRGRPMPPEVCIDFVTDTLERASGTWWRGRDAERARLTGGIDFDALDIDNRRSVDAFLRYARRRPEWFDVYDLAPEERAPFIQRAAFFSHLTEHAERYRPGDIIAIHGLRNDGEAHWHSFFVVEADPVTGVPTLLAGNAGHPRVQPWELVMRAAPLRSIKARVRPRLDWLEERLVGPKRVVAGDAPHGPSSPI